MKVAASLDHTAVRLRSAANAADGCSFLPLLIIHADPFTGINVHAPLSPTVEAGINHGVPGFQPEPTRLASRRQPLVRRPTSDHAPQPKLDTFFQPCLHPSVHFPEGEPNQRTAVRSGWPVAGPICKKRAAPRSASSKLSLLNSPLVPGRFLQFGGRRQGRDPVAIGDIDPSETKHGFHGGVTGPPGGEPTFQGRLWPCLADPRAGRSAVRFVEEHPFPTRISAFGEIEA